MKIHFLKYNFFRQLVFYSMIIVFGLIATDNKHLSIPVLIISGCIAAVFLFVLIYQCLCYLIVDDTGVTYRSLIKKYKLIWDEIEQEEFIRRGNNNEIVPGIIILKSDNHEDLLKKKNSFNCKGECITCAYSKKIDKQISRFRRGDIFKREFKRITDMFEK